MIKEQPDNKLLHEVLTFMSKSLVNSTGLEEDVSINGVRLPPKAIRHIKMLETAMETPAYIWKPNPDLPHRPNTQRLAYECTADIIGLSGTAGWGKTDLILGLAMNKHRKSVIFRRLLDDVRSIVRRSKEIYTRYEEGGVSLGFNGSLLVWNVDNGAKTIEFQACKMEEMKEKQRGRDRDLYAFDEAPQFTRSMCEFISGWNRSPHPDQHCQVIYAFNVPSNEGGGWVIDMFMPWIAKLFPDKYTHPRPAEPGELRWYATIDGKETELPNGDPIEHKGETIMPRSRTFFFGTLEDNPYYGNDYVATLQSMPEPERSKLLYGNFAAEGSLVDNQVIPTAWIREAMSRFVELERPENLTLSGVGVDVSRGGDDKTTICKRYGNWFDPVISYPGATTYDGPVVAQKVIESLLKPDGTSEEPMYINVDVIGVGSSPYDCLKDVYTCVFPINFAGATDYHDKSGKLKARNFRAEIYWRFRELLDPVNGHNICLPNDNELLADLAAATYFHTVSGFQIESKAEIKKRIGRSPDKGEAVLLASYLQKNWYCV